MRPEITARVAEKLKKTQRFNLRYFLKYAVDLEYCHWRVNHFACQFDNDIFAQAAENGGGRNTVKLAM